MISIQSGWRNIMPLWKVYHPVGAYSAQDKKEFAEKVTAMYSVSTVSSVRQTIRLGGNIQLFLACSTYADSPGPQYQPPVLLMEPRQSVLLPK
jgi:hypothetical protein